MLFNQLNMNVYQEWIENLKSFETLDGLQKSDFFSINGEEILSFFQTPKIHVHSDAVPRLNAFLRIAQWNIEKGKRFDPILNYFQNNEILKWADIIILNEADYGMNRSHNRHVALELADQLGMHMVYGPAHFELTKGTGDDLQIEGQNRESLQGNAILSRHPVIKAFLVPLPVTFEPFTFEEKRFGRRCCLWALLKLRQSLVWVGSVHLELRNTRRCRAFQIKYIMDNLPDEDDSACILGGDLNTNSFGRGTAWRTLQSLSRILWHPPERLKKQLLHPEKGREPLFEVAKQAGFLWESLNSSEETARTAMDTLEESNLLPGFFLKGVKKRLKPYGGYLCFKLDWFLAKHLEALGHNQKHDNDSKVASRDPGRIYGQNYGTDRISDHLPIYGDLDLC